MNHAYPRDLIGYGDTPPNPNWPSNAKIAVQFVLNYEEGGENCVLHGDDTSEVFLSEIIGAQAYKDRHLSMESMYEYGSRVGFWRLHRLFERLQVLLYCLCQKHLNIHLSDLHFLSNNYIVVQILCPRQIHYRMAQIQI